MAKQIKLEWHTEQRRVDDLVPWPKNPRQMTEVQAKDLEASIRKFGLVVNNENI